MVGRKSLALLTIICKCLLLVKLTQGFRYEFVFLNEDLFENCPDEPGTNGVHDLFNKDDLHVYYDDGEITVSGNVTNVWKNVQPTHRITGKFEIFKFFRGKWQVTPYTVFTSDWCGSMYDKTSLWYELWTQHIVEEDRVCINNYGHIYHHKPFKAAFEVDLYTNMEGRYKGVLLLEAFDTMQKAKNVPTICFQFVGDFFKL
ncbi:uncharacterized protein LOC142241358 [Haematobia irritans]|uniref:uncharacterized protein LOC142241358 n=1 Tax=Haematobia irritans TaxID=7368 RepID=UPI003F4FC16B